MRHLKTNEGFFSKDEIPKKLIDDIKNSIEAKYPVTIKKSPAEEERGIYDRVTFSTKTPIGIIDTVITFLNESHRDKYKLPHKILKVDVYYNKRSYVISDQKSKEWKSFDISSVLNNIDYIVGRINSEDKSRKEEKDFYDKISVDEIKDLCADLYDIIGEFRVNKTGRKGFHVIFDEVDGIPISNQSESSVPIYTPTDRFLEVMKELSSLNKRLNDGYNLIMKFTLVNNAPNNPMSPSRLKIMIYTKS